MISCDRPAGSSTIRIRVALLLMMMIATTLPALAQQGETEPADYPYRLGFGLAANLNTIGLDSAGVDFYDALDIGDTRTFNNDADGSGAGLYAAGAFHYVPGTIGFHGRIAYDDRRGQFLEGGSTSADVEGQLRYVSLEPSLRITPGESGLFFVVGPTFSFLSSDEAVFPDPATPTNPVAIPLASAGSSVTGLKGGAGFDIPFATDRERGTTWFVTPFAELSWLPEQSSAADRDWQTTTLRLGAELSFGWGGDRESVSTPPPSGGVDLTVSPPRRVSLGDRPVEEFFPLLNYLFFPDRSATIPNSYQRLSPTEAMRFSEGDLVNADPVSGPEPMRSRSVEQLRVYDNLLNVVGARMRDNPGTSISLVGADPDLSIAKRRADEVRDYLVENFGISPSRIETRGAARPVSASGTRSTPAEDRPMTTAENRRVEILSDDEILLRPVRIASTESDLAENDILFNLALTGASSIERWDLEVESDDGTFRQAYGPFYSGTARVSSSPLLASGSNDWQATARAVTYDGDEVGDVEPFRLAPVTTTATGSRRFSILFEYDDSRSIATYESFLRREVAPRIPDGSEVFIFGHTDVTGTETYNEGLSGRRAEQTMTVLADEIGKLGRRARFDAYGFGESPFRAPFGNDSPEERYYNRTVIIEIVPPGG